MSSSLEQIKEATKRKANGMFFIKSKHVPATFHNHSYFQMNPKIHISTEQPAQLQPKEVVDSQTQVVKRWKMFVDQPSSYGIENTFRYMCDRIRQSKAKNLLQLKKIQPKLPKQNQLNTTIRKQFAQQSLQKSRKKSVQKPTQKQSYRRQHARLKTEPANKYLQTTQSFNYRIRRSKYPSQERKQSPTKMLRYPGESEAEHFIEMIYIGGRTSYYDLELENKITFNLLPYIVNCFLKCKINYLKKLSQEEYSKIIGSIEQVKQAKKTYFDVKDIINLSSVQQVLSILEAYGEGSVQWIQTIRYFFMPSHEILDYQFSKMEDQIKVMSILKFNAQLNQQSIYIYRVEDKVKIYNIYDMLKPGTYIYSENKSVYEIYCSILKRKADLFSYKNRIKKWRSIAPLDQSQGDIQKRYSKKKVSILSERGSSQQLANVQKYKKLYELTQKRRKRNERSNLIANISYNHGHGILITHNSNNSFIDRSKLHHSEDIFE